MSTTVLERTTVDTDEPAEIQPAEAEWAAIAAKMRRMRIRFLVAATYDIRDRRGRTHLLALSNVRYGRRRANQFIPGLDAVTYSPYPAESAFCGTASNIHTLNFPIWRCRNEQDQIGVPNCPRCLRRCEAITDLPTDELRLAAGRFRLVQVRS